MYHQVLSRCLACVCLTHCSPLPSAPRTRTRTRTISLLYHTLPFSRPLSPCLARFCLPSRAPAFAYLSVQDSAASLWSCAVRYDNWARLHTDITARVFFTLRVSHYRFSLISPCKNTATCQKCVSVICLTRWILSLPGPRHCSEQLESFPRRVSFMVY